MNAASFALLIAPLLGLVIGACVERRRAIVWSMLVAWLFLPSAYSLQFVGLPDVDRFFAAAATGVCAAAVARPGPGERWVLPLGVGGLSLLTWICVPVASSVLNGIGAYDGLSAAFLRVVGFGLPFLLGFCVYGSPAGLRVIVKALAVGALVYLPLCLYEIRMSPSLHSAVYGFHQHVFHQARRGVGWRPVVFMQHGLAVAVFLAVGFIGSVGVWRSLRAGWQWLAASAVLLVLVFATQSVAAIVFAVGFGMLSVVRRRRIWGLGVATVCVALCAYPLSRAVLGWDAGVIVDFASRLGGDKSLSLQFRVENEIRLSAHAMRQPVFGWGGWGRNLPQDGQGEAVTDSLWILALGQNGIVGLLGLLGIAAAPILGGVRRVSLGGRGLAMSADDCLVAAGVGMALVVLADWMVNAMMSPLYLLLFGSLLGCARGRRQLAGE